MKLIWQRPVILLISSYPSIDEAGALYSEECNMLLDTVRKAAAKRYHIRLVHLHNPKNLQEIEQKIQKYRKRLLFIHYVGHSQQETVPDAYGVERLELHFDFGRYQPLRQKLEHIQENALLSNYIPLQGVFLHSCASDITEHPTANFPEIVTNHKVFDAEVAKHAQKFYRALLWDNLPINKAFAHSLAKEAVMGGGVARAFRLSLEGTMNSQAYRLKSPHLWKVYQLPKGLWLPLWLYNALIVLCILWSSVLSIAIIDDINSNNQFNLQDNRNVLIALLNQSDCSKKNIEIIQQFKEYINSAIDANYIVYNAYSGIQNRLVKLLAQIPLFQRVLKCEIPPRSFEELVTYAKKRKLDIVLAFSITQPKHNQCPQNGLASWQISPLLYIAPDISGSEFISTKALYDTLQNEEILLEIPCGNNQALKSGLQNIFQVKFKPILEFLALQTKLEQQLNHSTASEKFVETFEQITSVFTDYHRKIQNICQNVYVLYSQCKIREYPAEYSYISYYVSGAMYTYLYLGHQDFHIHCLDYVEEILLSKCANNIAAIVEKDRTFPKTSIMLSKQALARAVHAPRDTQCEYFHESIGFLEELAYNTNITPDIRYSAQLYIVQYHLLFHDNRGYIATNSEISHNTQLRVASECVTQEVNMKSIYLPLYSRKEGQCLSGENLNNTSILHHDIDRRYQRFLCWLETMMKDYKANYEANISTLSAIIILQYLSRIYVEIEYMEGRYAGYYDKLRQYLGEGWELITLLENYSQASELHIELQKIQFSLLIVKHIKNCNDIGVSNTQEVVSTIRNIEAFSQTKIYQIYQECQQDRMWQTKLLNFIKCSHGRSK